MSEQGWRAFLDADDLDDWAILHGGPTAVFRTASLVAAAELARTITTVPGLAGTRVALAITDSRLTVRLTREMWAVEASHIDLARSISDVARSHGAIPDLAAVQEVQSPSRRSPTRSTSASGAPSSVTTPWHPTTGSIR